MPLLIRLLYLSLSQHSRYRPEIPRLIGATTSIIPTIFMVMPFLLQPSQFILAWDRHQVRWLVYPMVWFPFNFIILATLHWYDNPTTGIKLNPTWVVVIEMGIQVPVPSITPILLLRIEIP